MFDLDRFIADCQAAYESDPTHKTVREVVAKAVTDDGPGMTRVLMASERSGITPLFRSDRLTILNVAWRPMMTIMPHDHRMWAVIGVYTGGEDNIYWRRVQSESARPLEAAGAQALRCGDTVALGRDIVHSVTNPLPRISAAVHVYGGDFVAAERSEFDPETLAEHPYDLTKNMRLFEDSDR